jgi:hypothetical protein
LSNSFCGRFSWLESNGDGMRSDLIGRERAVFSGHCCFEMRTKRQKTIKGQHLSPVELERDRAIPDYFGVCPHGWRLPKVGSPTGTGRPPSRPRHLPPPYGLKAGALASLSRRCASTGDADLARLSEAAEIR